MDWINNFYYSMFVKGMFFNQINISKLNFLSVDLLHTKSIHSPYTVSGIFERLGHKKSPNSLRIEAILSGADETRTRDLLRDRQAF